MINRAKTLPRAPCIEDGDVHFEIKKGAQAAEEGLIGFGLQCTGRETGVYMHRNPRVIRRGPDQRGVLAFGDAFIRLGGVAVAMVTLQR